MTEVELKPGERLDELQTGGFRLIQRSGTFCLGTDSVLLAHFCAPKRRERIADLGCGNGAISLLLAAYRPDCTVDGVELQAEMADMARRSVALNGAQDRVRIFCADLRQAPALLGIGGDSLVVCNPPYEAAGSGFPSATAQERIARQAEDLTLAELSESANRLLKYGGRFCAVFPARRAFELMHALHEAGLEPKRMQTVHARADKPPRVVLIEAVKGAASGLKWLEPLLLYDADGHPSAQLRAIYENSDADLQRKC